MQILRKKGNFDFGGVFLARETTGIFKIGPERRLWALGFGLGARGGQRGHGGAGRLAGGLAAAK